MQYDTTAEIFGRMKTDIGLQGFDASLPNIFLLGLLSALILLAMLNLIIKLRGQGTPLHLVCTRDFLLGVAWAIVPFAFPVFFYFVGRAYFRALTWRF